MEFSVQSNILNKQHTSCIVLSVLESYQLTPITEEFDKISNGYISTMLHREKIVGKIGQTLLLYDVPNILSDRILLIGCANNLNERQYKDIIKRTINVLTNTSTVEVIYFLIELHIKGRNNYWKIRQAIETIQESTYTFNQLKTQKNQVCHLLRKIIFNVSNYRDLNIGKQAVQHSLAIADGIKIAKDLSNMPPNICNASYIALQAQKLSSIYCNNITTYTVGEQQMSELGMNAYLAVGNGSKNESLMSIIKYTGNLNTDTRPIVLIGKGLTFDSGGISIKPSESMDEMKYDMCGAAAIYGVMHTIATLQLPLNVVGILACCENMPSGQSYRPGDILTVMSGNTVEVVNTDAEGRLVLCDVLTYVERFKPEIVIDVSTLTGACVIALGHHITGLMSNHNPLAYELVKASEQSGDRAWLLPMSDEFQEQLKSNFADISNISSGRAGGVITAGCFLSHFASKYHWAHLDIAGTAWHSGKEKGATGRPVAMLVQFLLNKTDLGNKE